MVRLVLDWVEAYLMHGGYQTVTRHAIIIEPLMASVNMPGALNGLCAVDQLMIDDHQFFYVNIASVVCRTSLD